MTRRTIALALLAALTLNACGGDDHPAAPTATPSWTPTRSATPTATASWTSTRSATPTATLSSTASATPSGTATATASATATATPTVSVVTALFRTDANDPANPFPSDRQRDATGHVRVSAAPFEVFLPPGASYDPARSYLANAAEQLSVLTGFSTFAPIRVPLTGAVTVADGESPPGIVVMRQDTPAVRARVRALAVTPDVAGDYAVEISPVVPFEPKTTYVYAVTTAVRDTLGQPVRPDPTLTDLLCNGSTSGTLAVWRTALTPALAQLATDGVACTDIALMDVFTTQPTTDDLITIRDLFDAGTLPIAEPMLDGTSIGDLAGGIYEEGTPQFTQLLGTPTSDAVRAVAVGRFPSFDFRGPTRTFDADLVAGTRQPRAVELAFYVALPKAPAPPGGYPLVIYGHGLGQSGQDALRTATSFADLPMVWVGISAVSHGDRGNYLNFFNLANVLGTRDNFRQTIADFLQLQRMIRHTTHSLFAGVNRDRFHYYGVSLGGIMGGLYMGVESDVRVGMLSVPGGGTPNILNGSDLIGDLIKPLIAVSLGVTVDDPLFPVILHRFIQLAQWTIDPGDPINTAPFILGPNTLPGVPPKRMLVHEGVTDSVVPNFTTEDLALAMRLPDLKATLGCSNAVGCSGIWRFVMTEYDQPSDCGHLVSFVVPEAHRQSINYLFTDGTVVEDASPRLAPGERPVCPDLTGALG